VKSKYKIVIIISFLLLTLSIGSSLLNYKISMNATQNQLKTQSLPLSVDNIYTEIQKHMIEPFLVASMMAHDTFVKDWLIQEENNVQKIQKYLDSIKNKYGMLATFLVSQKSKNYYTHNGLIEQIDEQNPTNKWYFEFKDAPHEHEINLDLNEHLANTLIMFINFKMLDDNFNYLGAAGVGIEISYINDMLKMFKDVYKLKVSFLDENANIILSEEHNQDKIINLDSISELSKYKDTILSKNTHIIEYEKDGYTHLLNTKYIEELNIYLLVEARLDNFTKDTKNTFYLNMTISLLLTLIITLITIAVISQHNKKLEKLINYDSLTQIPNRRNFKEKFEYLLLLKKRNNQPLSLLFIDLDNFKKINDNFGHKTGDDILKEFSSLLKHNIRKADIYARWGGEEFVIAFVDTPTEGAVKISNKLREIIQKDEKIKDLISTSLTISCGATQCLEDDTINTIIQRADQAMYNAKKSGKNKVCVL